MATIVPKGAGRASAAARTNKHAQRTPLPPRKGQVEEAKEVIAYGEMTRPQLLVEAERLGFSPSASISKGKLLEAILQAERDHRAAARAEAEKAPKKGPSAAVQAPKAETKSEAKAEAFRLAAVALGWKVVDRKDEGERVDLTVKRGEEAIDIAWDSGVFQYPCHHSLKGRTIQLRNASHAKQKMAVSPEQAEEEASRVVTRHASAESRKPGAERPKRRLPFDPELATDEEILDAVHGKKIVWTNGISGADYSDRVPVPKEVRVRANRPRITEGPSGRILNFNGEEGAHSVLVTKIVSVR